MNIPQNAKRMLVPYSSLPFYEYEDSYYFDSSLTAPPEPMVNALVGLELLEGNKKLIMINHKIPMGLFPKIEENFTYEIEELKDGNVKITFMSKSKDVSKLDFDTNCQG